MKQITKKVVYLALVWLSIFSTTTGNAQFIYRGSASVLSALPNTRVSPIQLMAEDFGTLTGYGMGNIDNNLTTNENAHIGLIKGRLNKGVLWEQKYFIKGENVKSVKLVQDSKCIYMLVNAMDGSNTNSLRFGVVKINPSDGTIITSASVKFGDNTEAYDMEIIDDKLYVACRSYYYDVFDYKSNGHLISLNTSDLSAIYRTKTDVEKMENCIPKKLCTDGKSLFVVSSVKLENNFDLFANVASYDVPGGNFSMINNQTYQFPQRLMSVNIAYNKYNDQVVCAFQQWKGFDATGDLVFISMEKYKLYTYNQKIFEYTRRSFNSNINIDEKHISISGSNNVFDMGTFKSNYLRVDHDLNFADMMQNPYQNQSSLIYNNQAIIENGALSLFATENDGKVNWVYGYGASKVCKINKGELAETKYDIEAPYKLFYSQKATDNTDFSINEDLLYFSYKIECGNTKRLANKNNTSNNSSIANSSDAVVITNTENILSVTIYDINGKAMN